MARRGKTRKKPVKINVFQGRRIGKQAPTGYLNKFINMNLKRFRPPQQISGKIQ